MKPTILPLTLGILFGALIVPHLGPAVRQAASGALALAGYHRGMIVTADDRLPPQTCRMGADGVTLRCTPGVRR